MLWTICQMAILDKGDFRSYYLPPSGGHPMTHPLAAYRKEKEITRTQMAHLIGCHVSYVGHIEEGGRRPAPGLARLLFIGLWNFADDYGNLERSSKQIKIRIFPADAIDIEPHVQELIQ